MKKLIIIAAIAATAQAQDCQQWAFAGIGVNGGSGSVSGVAAYGKPLATVAGKCLHSVSAVNVTGGIRAPQYTFSSGAMIEILRRPEFSLSVGGDLGIAQQVITSNATPTASLDTLTEFAKAGGVILAWRKLPTWVPPNVSLAGAYRYQPTGNANGSLTLGIAWRFGE